MSIEKLQICRVGVWFVRKTKEHIFYKPDKTNICPPYSRERLKCLKLPIFTFKLGAKKSEMTGEDMRILALYIVSRAVHKLKHFLKDQICRAAAYS